MAILRTTCPDCSAAVGLIPDEVLLTSPSSEPDGEAEYAFVCPACDDFVSKAADDRVVALLLEGGVVPLEPAPALSHPETPPAGRPLCADDLLDLHLLLASDRWFEQLLATTPQS